MEADVLDVTLILATTSREATYRAQWVAPDAPPVHGDREFSLSVDELHGKWQRLISRELPQPPPTASELRDEARRLGTFLFERIVQGNTHECYSQAYSAARQAGRRFRLRLQLPEQLENLPFELLYDAGHELFLGANDFTTLVRTTIGRSIESPAEQFPLRLLVVAARPDDKPPIDVDHEIHILEQGLHDLVELGMWRIDVLRGRNTREQLQTRSDRRRFHVLHFIGHGMVDPQKSYTRLVLEDAAGKAQPVETSALRPVLAGYTDLRLVVLNCCHGGQAIRTKPYASIAHELLRVEIAAVIAMQRRIADKSAILLTDQLYRGIAHCLPIDEAVSTARMSLLFSDQIDAAIDWFNPQVYLRVGNGRLFTAGQEQLPWEQKVAERIALRDFNAALDILNKVGQWRLATELTGGRIVQHLGEIVEAAIQAEDWDTLARTLDHCRAQNLLLAESDRWRRLVDNRCRWNCEVTRPIAEALRSGDPLKASRAVRECDRVIQTLAQGVDAAAREFYDQDTTLYERFWAADLDQLRSLRSTYGGPVLAASGLELMEAVELLKSQGGLPTAAAGAERGSEGGGWRVEHPDTQDVSEEFGSRVSEPSPRTTPRAPLATLLSDVFVHPVNDMGRLDRVRDFVVRAHPTLHGLPLESLIEQTETVLEGDTPLVMRALGWDDRAVAAWEAQLRFTDDALQAMGIVHHLALAGFPLLGESTSASPREGEAAAERLVPAQQQSLDERALCWWAVLLADDPTDELSYWRCWASKRQRVPQEDHSPAMLSQVVEQIECWIEERLSAPVATAPPAPPDASVPHAAPSLLRDIEPVFVDTPETPAGGAVSPVSPREANYPEETVRPTISQCRFAAELAGALIIRKLLRVGVSNLVRPHGGWSAVLNLRRGSELVAAYRELEQRVRAQTDSAAAETQDEDYGSYDVSRLRQLLENPPDVGAAADDSLSIGPNTLRQLRFLFSSLRLPWIAVQKYGDPRTGLELLAKLPCELPDDVDERSAAAARFVDHLPSRCRPTLGKTSFSSFSEANPIHGSADNPSGLFLADLERLYASAFVELICRPQNLEAIDLKDLEELVATMEFLSWRSSEAVVRISQFQERIAGQVRDRWDTADDAALAQRLNLLRLVARLGATPSVREAISEGLVRLAGLLLEHAEYDRAILCVSEALDWDPDSAEARELKCYAILNGARRCAERGDAKGARLHLDELDKVVREAARPKAEMQEVQEEAAKLAASLETLEPAETDQISIFPPDDDDDSWKHRLADAREAMQTNDVRLALSCLDDAALLVPDDRQAQDQVAAAFVELFCQTDDLEQQLTIINRAR